MKRLVYSPKINAYIKADSGVYDISEYIVDFNIDRKINQVSTAELNIRNPNFKWTNYSYRDTITGEIKTGPVFHPMDPITIILTRLQNKPVQVFTGFCDQTPYLQLFPGTVPIKASCTLKKLQYTYFDAGLPFMREFLEQNGWLPNEDGSIVKPEAEQINNSKNAKESTEGVRYGDSGIGELLFKVLNEIGNWPEDTIYIQDMPPKVIELVSNLFELFKQEDEEASKELTKLLTKIVGTSVKGTGGPGGGESPTDEGNLGKHNYELGDTSVTGHPELKPGVSEVVNAILKQFPSLEITSTTGGEHAANSLHYLGRAADLAYPMTSKGIEGMNNVATWINSSGLWEHLTEGIHNPGTGGSNFATLSVKEGKKVPPSFWGEPTWAEHENHIHVGV